MPDIEDRLFLHHLLGLACTRHFKRVCDAVANDLDQKEESHRKRFYIDDTHLLKSTKSIRSKIGRANKDNEGKGFPLINETNFHLHLNDLVRFRIVGVVTSDIEALWERCLDELEGNTCLGALFEWKRRKDTVRDPTGGERSLKLVLELRASGPWPLQMEIQLVTAQASAWDAANHAFYELNRSVDRDALAPETRAQIEALEKAWSEQSESHAHADAQCQKLLQETLDLNAKLGADPPALSAAPAAAPPPVRLRPTDAGPGLQVCVAAYRFFLRTRSVEDVVVACRLAHLLPDSTLTAETKPPANCDIAEASQFRTEGAVRMKLLGEVATRIRGGLRAFPPPVEGGKTDADNFLGRSRILTEATEHLHAGTPLIVVAPRRFGKSCFLSHLARILDDAGHYTPLYVDVGSVTTPDKLIRRIVEKLLERDRDSVLQIPAAIRNDKLDSDREVERNRALNKLEVAARMRDPIELLEELLSTLGARAGSPVLVILDEFPWLIEALHTEGSPGSRAECTRLLDILDRRHGRLRMVLSGSLYLGHVLRRWNLPELSGWTELHIPPWADAEAGLVVRVLALGYGLELDDDAIDAVIREVGVEIPFFVQSLLDELKSSMPPEGGGSSAVRNAHLALIASADKQTSPYAELEAHPARYASDLDNERALEAAQAILDRASGSDGDLVPELRRLAAELLRVAPDDGTLDLLMDMLRHDFYLRLVGPDRLAFRNNAVRNWWRQQRGL